LFIFEKNDNAPCDGIRIKDEVMMKRTALYNEHVALHARLVEFAGWEMPLHYGSQLEEHQYVRKHAGIFDVSHMNITDVIGEQAYEFLRYVLANDVAKLTQPGKAIYSCMLDEKGGVLDDLVVYFLAPQHYRLVLNAGTRHKDSAWLQRQAAAFKVIIQPHDDLSIIALQGPRALDIVESVFGGLFFDAIAALKPFHFASPEGLMIARTGYTGEDGFEILMPAMESIIFWQKLLGAGARPIGLGARDTLRLEAGFNLYGADMDESTTPYEANLGWTVVLDHQRQFIGQAALLKQQQQGVARFLVGLVLPSGGVLRHGQQLFLNEALIGEITSGGFSPSLNCSIAMARVTHSAIKECTVAMRGKLLPVKVVKPAFVRHGKSLVD
jgi:aminomethyltransferase